MKEAGVPQLSKVLLEESPSQAVLSCAIGELHASLQQSVDLMGVGSNVPRLDTVGEDKAGLSLASMPLFSMLHICLWRLCTGDLERDLLQL